MTWTGTTAYNPAVVRTQPSENRETVISDYVHIADEAWMLVPLLASSLSGRQVLGELAAFKERLYV